MCGKKKKSLINFFFILAGAEKYWNIDAVGGTRGSVQPGNFSPTVAKSGCLHKSTRTEKAYGHCIYWLYYSLQTLLISGSRIISVECVLCFYLL